MAFDKKNAGLGKKIGITVVCVLLALAMTIPSLVLLFSDDKGSSSTTSTTDSASAATTAEAATVADIDAEYEETETALIASAEAAPDDNTYNETIGNLYFDWALDLMAYTGTEDVSAHLAETWAKCISYYDTFLEKGSSAPVEVDRAIAFYYSGDTQSAIDSMLAFTAMNEDYSPAWANLGLFYESRGETDLARESYNKALEVDPEDEYEVATFVNGRLESL
ncbi:MAG: tetratricopeptide repeat protein [Actinobacteria bacterium]|nr:tetratricopeptide repeat protein [Actinomycetota bacterium]